MNLALGPEVPPEYLGVWKRTLLRTPKIEDTTTQVYWMQTQSWHADIRVPASRPDFSEKSGSGEMTRSELMELAKQQGFCGTTVVDDEISFGKWESGNSTGRIELSTLPWKQGTTISISGS